MLAALSAVSGGREALKSVGRRLALAAGAGLLVGAYIALEFFPGQGALQVSSAALSPANCTPAPAPTLPLPLPRHSPQQTMRFSPLDETALLSSQKLLGGIESRYQGVE